MAHTTRCGALRMAGGAISVCLLTRIRWPSEWSMALLNSKRDGIRGRREAKRHPEFTGNTAVGPPIQRRWWGCDSSQWDSVLGQGSAYGYDQLFKRCFWLSCPFSTMNARCKAPGDALNVIKDYSWLTNRQAGSAPINPARFSPIPFQGDLGGVATAGWEE